MFHRSNIDEWILKISAGYASLLGILPNNELNTKLLILYNVITQLILIIM